MAYNKDYLSTDRLGVLFLATTHNVAYRKDIVVNGNHVDMENIPARMNDLEDKGEVILPCRRLHNAPYRDTEEGQNQNEDDRGGNESRHS